MASPASADDWGCIDNWWASFKRNQPIQLVPSAIRALPDVDWHRYWSTVVPFWSAFEADHEMLLTNSSIQKLSNRAETDAWIAVDDLWNSYADEKRDDLVELEEMMAKLGEIWGQGASQFSDDPLAVNWKSESQYNGPLRTTINEEDWSQWLAHLLRTSSGPFPHELLGTPNRPPTKVRREVVFFGDSSSRRVDILVEYEDIGVSIEVKKGDKHYRKTPETAGLIEENDRRDWSHVLLLQKDKLQRLRQTFDDDLEQTQSDLFRIRSDCSADIDVRYWQDVSRILRQLLLGGREPGSHWKASAYLFITLIEQRILGLHSFSFVERGGTTDIHRLVVANPSVQTEYLRGVLDEDTNHE